MKKERIFIILQTSLLVLCFALISCGGLKLTNTTWVYEMTRAEMAKQMFGVEDDEILAQSGIPEKMVLMEMEFTASAVKIWIFNPLDGSKELLGEGTYSVKGNVVTISSDGISENVTISGNKFTFDMDGYKTTFVKK